MNNTVEKRKVTIRFLLYAYLASIILFFVKKLSNLNINDNLLKSVSKINPNFSGWYGVYEIIFVVFELIALFGIWKWKKWGVYMILVLQVIFWCVRDFLLSNTLTGVSGLIFTNPISYILGLGFIVYYFYKNWDLFEN